MEKGKRKKEKFMKNTVMIKKNYEFKKFFSKGKFYLGEYINMYIHFNKIK